MPLEKRPHSGLERMPYMPITEAQKKATMKYMKNNYDRIELKVPKGKKSDLQAHAADRGESLNGFVNRAIDGQIERDKERGEAANASTGL